MDGFRPGKVEQQEVSFEYDGELWSQTSHYRWELEHLQDFKEHMIRVDDTEILLLWSSTKKLDNLQNN